MASSSAPIAAFGPGDYVLDPDGTRWTVLWVREGWVRVKREPGGFRHGPLQRTWRLDSLRPLVEA